MSCNCGNILDLGCFDSCYSHNLGDLEATETGIHVYLVKVLGETFKLNVDLQATQAIYLDLTLFNEDADIIVSITNPDGSEFTYSQDEIEYNCFKLRSQIINLLGDE